MFNLATARVTTSNNSSYCGDRVGEKPVLSTSSSSEGDRWNTGPALWGEETAERASEPRERAVDLAGEDRDRGLPVQSLCQIQLRAPRVQPPLHLSGGGASTVRSASENSLLEESSPGAKRVYWKPLTMRAAGFLKRIPGECHKLFKQNQFDRLFVYIVDVQMKQKLLQNHK